MQRRCVSAVARAPSCFRAYPTQFLSCHRSLLSLPVLSFQRAFNAGSRLPQDVVALRKELKDADKASRGLKKQGNLQDGRPVEDVEAWELTVGIEIHAQLNTARKLFSFASTSPTEIPNTRLAPFDLALPGSQPVFQYATLIPALRAALALNCDIQPVSSFDRKHYFYHDQPSGYQITQYYHPFATNGYVRLDESDGLPKGDELQVGIKQIQMEQDTARTRDQDADTSLVDFNRAGHPLIEIISLPHIHTPRAAAAYVRKIQGILSSVDALMAGLEMGGMRADVNVSVRRTDSDGVGQSYSGVVGLGQRTEIKNLSAFNGIESAVRAERDRQIALLEGGGVIAGETRGWSVTNPHTTRSLRGKEGEVDYRYMPDPDIPPLYISEDIVQHLHDTMPISPEQSIHILCTKYGLSELDAGTLLSLGDGQERLHYFLDTFSNLMKRQRESTTTSTPPSGIEITPLTPQQTGRVVANYVLHELGSLLSTSTEQAFSPSLIPSTHLSHLIHLQHYLNLITSVSAKRLLRIIFDGDKRPVKEIITAEGLLFNPMSDAEYAELAAKIIANYPDHVKDIRKNGKVGKVKFLLGQMMRSVAAEEKGRIQAQRAEEVLKRQLEAKPSTAGDDMGRPVEENKAADDEGEEKGEEKEKGNEDPEQMTR